MFRLENIRLVENGQLLLRVPQLQVAVGEQVAIVGPSGAGKSLLLGRLRASCRAPMGWCPQQHGLVDSLSVAHALYSGQLDQRGAWENLRNLIHLNPRVRGELTTLALELGLEAQLEQAIHSLSGGEQQRVALGRAWFSQRQIFLGDEPITAMDPSMARRLLEATLGRHPTAIVVLHQPGLAQALFERVLLVEGGEIRADVQTKSMRADELQQWLHQSATGRAE